MSPGDLSRLAVTQTLGKSTDVKKLWDMEVTVIAIITGVLGTVTKGLVQELEDLEMRGRVETIQTTALLRSARILTSHEDLGRNATA